MIFEDPAVSFLPYYPVDEAWKEVPESIEKRALERIPRLVPDGVYDLSLSSSCSSVTLCCSLPKLSC